MRPRDLPHGSKIPLLQVFSKLEISVKKIIEPIWVTVKTTLPKLFLEIVKSSLAENKSKIFLFFLMVRIKYDQP
jgi:hypothetical protein